MSRIIALRIMFAVVLGIGVGMMLLHILQTDGRLTAPYFALGIATGFVLVLLLTDPERTAGHS